MTRTSGVYLIHCRVSGKSYVGSSVHIEGRWRGHVHSLNKNLNEAPKLQAAWNKYGQDAFEFSVIETCDEGDCIRTEQKYLDLLQTWRSAVGYNVLPKAGSRLGVPQSEEARKKMSIAKKGKPGPRLGCKLTDEQRQKLKGKPVSDETKEKIRASLLGRKNGPMSQETKNKISERHRGKKCTEKMRKMVSERHAMFTPEQIMEMISLRKAGLSFAAMAVRYGVTKSCLASIFRGRIAAYRDIIQAALN